MKRSFMVKKIKKIGDKAPFFELYRQLFVKLGFCE